MKIWIDITNTPHIHFFLPIIRHIQKNHETIITARDFSETLPLLTKLEISYTVIGNHKGKSKLKKVLGLFSRIIKLYLKVPKFDISMSIGGQNTTIVSYFRRKPSLIFTDNDTSYKFHSYKLGSYFIFPSYFQYNDVMKKYGVKKEKIFLYSGFKEDIYIADYKPDPKFIDELPFDDFITIRPENLKASYVPKNSKTIVPELFEEFKEYNILFIPRYQEEKKYADGYENIFIPNYPLNGLDVCYYTKAMLTGAGTFAREAAIIGTPAVSFFPGNIFLTVDKIMQEKGWEYKSRSVSEIMMYVQNAKKKKNNLDRCKSVRNELLYLVDKIIKDITVNGY